MGTQTVPYNIQSHAAALAEGLSYGDRVHVGVVGNHKSDDLFFKNFTQNKQGIEVVKGSMRGIPTALCWGDIVELWLLEEKPNIYYSDVPEVAEILKKLKAGVQKCVQDDNCAGVLCLLDQVSEVKKAEPLFKEAREIIASVRL